MKTRKELLQDLVNYKMELKEILIQLNHYPWDSEEALITIGADEIHNILSLAAKERITLESLEDWANAIEVRDDLDIPGEIERQVIDELANPFLYDMLTITKVNELINRLNIVS